MFYSSLWCRFTTRFPTCARGEPFGGGRICTHAVPGTQRSAGSRSDLAQERRIHWRMGRWPRTRQRKVHCTVHSAACSNNCLLVVEYFIIINTIIIAGSMWKRREISSSGTCWRQTRASTSASLTIWPPLENHPPSHYPSTVSCLLLPSFSPLLSSPLLFASQTRLWIRHASHFNRPLAQDCGHCSALRSDPAPMPLSSLLLFSFFIPPTIKIDQRAAQTA